MKPAGTPAEIACLLLPVPEKEALCGSNCLENAMRPACSGNVRRRHRVSRPSVTQTKTSEIADESRIKRLMAFFAMIYVVEGFGQTDGIIAQPLNFYLKENGWTTLEAASFLSLFALPWLLKPVYGAITDFIPVFQYRRKSYLVLANLMILASYIGVAKSTSPGSLAGLLIFASYGTAILSTVAGAVLAENGQRFQTAAQFVRQQWLAFSIAATVAAFAGGQLVERLSATSALQIAALLAGSVPLIGIFAALNLDEEKQPIAITQFRETVGEFRSALTSRRMLLLALFLAFYSFNPFLGQPLYRFTSDKLHFSQSYIGILGSVQWLGWIVGAIIHRRFIGGFTEFNQLRTSLIIGGATQLSFVFLESEWLGAVIYFCNGAATVICVISTRALAAAACLRRSEGLSLAILLLILDLTSIASENFGAFAYDHLFHGQLYPLVLISVGFTSLAVLVIPLVCNEARHAVATRATNT